MYFLYDWAVKLTAVLLHLPALFQPKIRRFLNGRKEVWDYLEAFRDPKKPLIWLHAASLGEFEQGLPVLEKLMAAYPDHQFLVSFFSPSGYEVKKNKVPGAGVCYLPLDTRSASRRFLTQAAPSLAIFVKYEVWPNLYRELERAQIPNVMISALFKPHQIYFRWYGGFMKKALKRVRHFYLQDTDSGTLLQSLGMANYTVCGDTRFDRVLEIREKPVTLEFMERFKGGRTCLVAGSTWAEDEEVILPYIRNLDTTRHCAVIAPHSVDPATVSRLQEKLGEKAVCYSSGPEALDDQTQVLILDTIGLLTRTYRYADVAYVGGGFATGLHNTLEPAVFGIPVLIGPKFQGFREAEDLVKTGGIRPVGDRADFEASAGILMEQPEARDAMGRINTTHIEKSRGASRKIVQGIRPLLKP